MTASHRQSTPRRRGSPAGFTLIELIVVAAIIGIIASITVAAMSGYRDRARTAQVVEEVRSFQHAAAIYFAANGSYPVPSNPEESCTNGYVSPNVCCVSQDSCDYGGIPLVPATFVGDSAAAPSLPRWLAALAETAHAAILGDALPNLPHQPSPANAGGISYQGIFYACTSSSCAAAEIVWTQSTATCRKGTTHTGADDGVCEQDITGTSGGSGGGSSGGGTEDCTNGVDDSDADTDVDCDDSDCQAVSECNDCACETNTCGSTGSQACETNTCSAANDACETNTCGTGSQACETNTCSAANDACETNTCGVADEPCYNPASNPDPMDCGTGSDPCETNTCGVADDPCYPSGDPMSCDDGVSDDPCYNPASNPDPMNCGAGSSPCYDPMSNPDPMSCQCW